MEGYDRFLIDDLNETKKFLKHHKELIISKADKGGATVIMYKKEYDQEMGRMLEDDSTYLLLKKDPTIRFQNRVNVFIEELKSEGYIDTRVLVINLKDWTLNRPNCTALEKHIRQP